MALSLPLRRALPQLPPLSFLSTASYALPISITIPPLLADLWESVLRAVPKKKTSHMKKRHRQMAGKALKDVQSLNKCPGCGQIKRAHVLCPHCVKGTTDTSFRSTLGPFCSELIFLETRERTINSEFAVWTLPNFRKLTVS